MTNGKDVKPQSIRNSIRYLIACIAILIWLGFLSAYWPTALAIAVIGGIIWRSRKSSPKQVQRITDQLDQIAGNTPRAARLSSMRKANPSIPGPMVAIKYVINRSIGRPTVPGTNNLQWASYEDILEVASYRIKHPMIYWATGKTCMNEASCIEKNLPVGKPISEPIVALGYWSRYKNMTPSQRGNYLSWLADGKQGHLDDIGYIFVYFYGLERRVLIDGKDVNLILPEIFRLMYQYPESESFNRYSSCFIAYVVARTGPGSLTKDNFKLCFGQALLKDYSEDLLAVILSRFDFHNLPLSACWAFEVARREVPAQRSVVADRMTEGFRSLFMQKYSERFRDGMRLRVASNERLIEYHPANPSLMDQRYSSDAFAPIRISNVLGIQSQFEPLVRIWNECIDELRAYRVRKEIALENTEAVQKREIPFRALLADMHQSGSQAIEVQTGLDEAHAWEAIPMFERMSDIVLDEDVLKRKIIETEEVSCILNEVLSETEGDSEGSNTVIIGNSSVRLGAFASHDDTISSVDHMQDVIMNSGALVRKIAERSEESHSLEHELGKTESKPVAVDPSIIQTQPNALDLITSFSKTSPKSEILTDIIVIDFDNKPLESKIADTIYGSNILGKTLCETECQTVEPDVALIEDPLIAPDFKTASDETIPKPNNVSDIIIDDEVLKSKMIETEDVSRILDEVLSETRGDPGGSNTVIIENSSVRLDASASHDDTISKVDHMQDVIMNNEALVQKTAKRSEESHFLEHELSKTESKPVAVDPATIQTQPNALDLITSFSKTSPKSEILTDIIVIDFDNKPLESKIADTIYGSNISGKTLCETECQTVEHDAALIEDPLIAPDFKTASDETIPKPNNVSDIIIDDEVLKSKMIETEDVSRILDEVLSEAERKIEESNAVVKENLSIAPDVITLPISANLPFSDEHIAALNTRYFSPLAELLTRKVWSSDEMAELARRYQFMPSGLIDAINTWADEAFGDDILVEKDGKEYILNSSLMEA